MMNILNDIKSQTSQIKNERFAEAEFLYYKGLEAMERAEEEGFSDMMTLQEASVGFTESLKRNRSDIRPYIGLAFLFLSMGDVATASGYYQGAKSVDANHPILPQLNAALQETMDEQRSRQKIKKSDHSPDLSQSEATDYDELYDESEKLIREAVRYMMNRKPSQPAATEDELKELEKTLKKYIEWSSQINQRLHVVDQEIDISELVKMLKPFAQMLKHQEELVQQSSISIALLNDIQRENALILSIVKEAKATTDPEDLPILEENLEVLLDNLDQFKQRRLQLRFKHFALDKALLHLNTSIEIFSDVLDETSENFMF